MLKNPAYYAQNYALTLKPARADILAFFYKAQIAQLLLLMDESMMASKRQCVKLV